jgi:hypothetical protein
MDGFKFIPIFVVITAMAVLLLIVPTWNEYGKNISVLDRIERNAFPVGLLYLSVITVLCFKSIQERLRTPKKSSSDEMGTEPPDHAVPRSAASIGEDEKTRYWWVLPVLLGICNSVVLFATIKIFVPESPIRTLPEIVQISYNIVSWILLSNLAGAVSRAVTVRREGVQYFIPPGESPRQLRVRLLLTALSFILLLAGSAITFGFMWFVWALVGCLIMAYYRPRLQKLTGKDHDIGVPLFTFCSGIYFLALGLQQHGWKWTK